MKKLLSIVTLLVLLATSVFAKPTKIREEYSFSSGESYTFWQLESIPEDSDISVLTTSFSAMEILDVNDDGKITNKFYKINMGNQDLVYLIAKYGYVIIDVPNEGSVLETELDFGYVAFELDYEE